MDPILQSTHLLFTLKSHRPAVLEFSNELEAKLNLDN